MAIPSIEQIKIPFLEVLGDGLNHRTRDVWEQLSKRFNLTSDELAETNESGKFTFRNRIAWARTHLKRDGLLEYPGTSLSRITEAGLAMLGQLPAAPPSAEAAVPPLVRAPSGTLEKELRRLTGAVAKSDSDWQAICLLNGWSSKGVHGYKQAARLTGRSVDDLLKLARKCDRVSRPDAPILDAALTMAMAYPAEDPVGTSYMLVRLGLAESEFSIPGLAEAARRFGRTAQWRALIAYLAAHRSANPSKDCLVRPRPFDSWFEVDVFLFVTGLGYEVDPQGYVGGYRADLLLPDLDPKVIIECDGEKWHREDRADGDREREHELADVGYQIIRLPHRQWIDHRQRAETNLRDAIEMHHPSLSR